MGQHVLHHDPAPNRAVHPKVLARSDIQRNDTAVGFDDANLGGAGRTLKELPLIVLR
jgi:hypothetical protein